MFRSDALHHLVPGDVDLLTELGMRTVIDLRSVVELDRTGRGPLEETDMQWLHAPLSHGEAAAGRVLPFQTRRSRLYRAASRVALGDRARARQIVAEALATNPDLTTDYIQQRETYRDPTVKRLLIDRLAEAGLPRAAAVAR